MLSTSGPGSTSKPVNPAVEEYLARPSFLRVDVAGTVKFTDIDGNTDTWTCVDGDIIWVLIKRVWNTGTTATGLHAIEV